MKTYWWVNVAVTLVTSLYWIQIILAQRNTAHRNKNEQVGYEVPTAVVMKISIFWHVTPCSPVKFNLLPASCWFLAWFNIRLWRWRRLVPPYRRLTFTDYTALYPRIFKSENVYTNFPNACFAVLRMSFPQILHYIIVSCFTLYFGKYTPHLTFFQWQFKILMKSEFYFI
jgi:hypothetical protein